MREAAPQINALGAKVVAVATGAPHQARRLMSMGIPFPCLVDPDKNLYRELGIARIAPTQWFRPSTWGRYLRGLSRARPGRFTGDVLQAPGVAIIDPEGLIRYLHRGTTLGDYPPVGEVVAELQQIGG